MISLDIRTVIYSFILINIVSTIVAVYLWISFRNRYSGIGRLACAFLLQLVAYTFIILRGKIPIWLSSDAGNALSVIGIIIGYTGLQEYTGRKINYLPGILVFVTAGILHIWFSYLQPHSGVRLLLLSAANFSLFSYCSWLMISGVNPGMKSLTRYTGFVFAGLAIMAGIKIIDFLIRGELPSDYFQSGSFEAATIMAYQVLIILLIISISLMLGNHLHEDIKTEEEKFSTIFRTAPNAIVLTTFPDGKILEGNTAFCTMATGNHDELKGASIFSILSWNDEGETLEILADLSAGKPVRKECVFRKKTGDLFTGLFTANTISLTSGKRLIISIYDISEPKQLREVIRQDKNFMRTLLDILPDPVSVKDSDGKYILSNRAHMQVIGAEKEEDVIGKTAYDFFQQEDAESQNIDDSDVLNTGKMIIDKTEFSRHPETGFPLWYMTSRIPLKDESGKPFRVLTISHDITERKRAEDSLRETDKFNRSLLKTIPFGMDVVDETGTILFMGENFRRMFGNDASGKKCWELYRDNGQQCDGCPLKQGIKSETTEVFESHGLLGGKVFEISHTGMLYHGRKAMLEVFHDITERKKNEGELIRSKEIAEENDRLKTAFLHNISHEIRTPMNAIVGFANLLREPGISPEEHKIYTDIISKSSNHLLSIVNDVIEISNVEAGNLRLTPEEINIPDFISDMHQKFAVLASDRGLQFNSELPAGETGHIIITDRTKLNQVLAHILDNAFKFTSKGRISFGYSVKEPYIEFFVSDTGIGIDPEVQPRVFDRFFQADNSVTRLHEGTGIGLSISKAYVELMGGRIWLKSVPGRGSIFCFTVPVK